VPDKNKTRETSKPFEGVDRRNPNLPDRRRSQRGGRRATDVLGRAAGFVYKLLTEPPR
jgi:hypothetical protein